MTWAATWARARPARLGLWQRLMLSIVGLALALWLVAGIGVLVLARLQGTYVEMAQSQLPRMALTSELAGQSAEIAGLATRLIGGEVDEEAFVADLTAVSDRLARALEGIAARAEDLRSVSAASQSLQGQLSALLPQLRERRALAARIGSQIEMARFLIADIQDEVEPLLDDYDFNVETMMLRMERSDSAAERSRLVGLIGEERSRRDVVARIGVEAGMAVTLVTQAATATDPLQVEQLAAVLGDVVARVGETTGELPERPEYLTLRQSIEELGATALGPEGLVAARSAWINVDAQILGGIAEVQGAIAALQDDLSDLAARERGTVMATVSATAGEAQWTLGWLIAVTVAVGLVGAAAIFRVIRRGIVAPLGRLTDRMLAIAEGPAPGRGSLDDMARLSHAVEAFHEAILARDGAIADLRATQDDLVQAGKMAALGQLSAGIGHELSQPLSALRYRLVLLDDAARTAAAPGIEEQCGRLGGLVDRMDAIVSLLRRFGRRAEKRRELLRLGDLVDDVLTLMGPSLQREGVRLVVTDRARAARIESDPLLVEQVLLNLLSNAADAIEDAGRPGLIEIDAQAEDGACEVTVTDDGIGLGGLSARDAIDPFVTTKAPGRGMGLGLSISYNIVRDLGGDLSLGPAAGQGTVARLRLPEGPRANAA